MDQIISGPRKSRIVSIPAPSPGKAQTNYSNRNTTQVALVPNLTEFFDSWPAGGWKGKISRGWLKFFQGVTPPAPIIGFWMPAIDAGAGPVYSAGPILSAARSGNTRYVAIAVRASDPGVNLSIDLKQNGVSIFQTPPVIPAGAAQGSQYLFSNLTATPLWVNQNDTFSLDVLTGSTSWYFTAQLSG